MESIKSPGTKPQGHRQYRRRGAAAALVAISLVTLIGFAALAVDGGMLYLAKTELQRGADASALAAASAILSDEGRRGEYAEVMYNGTLRAIEIASRNTCLNTPITMQDTNVTFGRLEDPSDLSEPFTETAVNINAARVWALRTNSSPDGPIELFFARIFGKRSSEVGAFAVAVLDDRFSGYEPRDGGGPFIPFTVLDTDYDAALTGGDDNFSYEDGVITEIGDGIPEVRLFADNHGAGNWGTLNVGVGNEGTAELERQILDGVNSEDLFNEIGSEELTFFDEAGLPITYEMTGNPGISAGMRDTVEARLGDIIGFVIFTGVPVESGSNLIYTITNLRFGRIVGVDFHGVRTAVIIQPTDYQGPEINTDPDAPSTDLRVTKLHLVR